jgi:hypothetical protein
MKCLRPLKHWDRGFESHSRHGGLTAFILVVLSCVDSGLTTGWSPIQRVLPTGCKINKFRILNEVVGIATSYGLDDQGIGVRVPVGSRIFSTSSRPALGSTQPPIQWVRGAFSLVLKQPGREADNSPLASAKKMWIYTSTPPYVFMA